MLKTPDTLATEQRLDSATAPMTAQDMPATAMVWDRVQRRLRAELGEDVYTSWFKCLELVHVQEDTVTLSVPTKFLRNWIQQHFVEKITAHFQKEDASIARVAITMRSTSLRPAVRTELSKPAEPVRKAAQPDAVASHRSLTEAYAKAAEARSVEAQDGDLQVGSPLDKRLVLSSFQVGRSNIMAHAAAMQIVQAKAGEMPVFNPLYVHASVGLGKTHLLQGAAQAVEAAGRRVLYLTAERFMYGFVASLKAQTAIAFKDTLRGIDVLIIDDAQFLHGPKSQQEFCHTLNALIDAGKQVVVAADRAPSDLEGIEERCNPAWPAALLWRSGRWMMRCASRSWKAGSRLRRRIFRASTCRKRLCSMSRA